MRNVRSCSFEKWDKSRHIYTPPLPEEHIRPLMEYLANWIYKDAQLRAGITTMELAVKATEYLNYWLYEDRYKAEQRPVSLSSLYRASVGFYRYRNSERW